MNQHRAKFLGMLLGLSILAGCSSGGGGTAPPTATLTANPTSFTANQGSSVLSFTSTNADSGSIDNGVGVVGINSQVRVTPAKTTTYTSAATGPGGSATATATVTVTPATPPTATLTANPTSFTANQGSSVLSFTSTNADSGSIDNGVGVVGINSQVRVTPAKTTTYTSAATGPGGSATATPTVTVTPATPPTATLTANPTSFTANQGSSVLSFTSTNADSGSIDNGVGAVGINSQVRVTPAVTTTYTYTATGPGGSATAQATVTVIPAGPPPTVTLSASPTSIFAGQSATLSWTSTNATSVVLDNNLGAVQPLSSGSITVSPTQTTTYTATATGDGQQITSPGTTVTVSPLTSFDGIPADTSNLGTFSQDVDPNGAVGTKQYMEYVNIEYQGFDKVTHAPVWPTPQLIGTPFTNSLNSGDLYNCDGHTISTGLSGIHLDAVINFDRLAKRWVVMGRSDFSGPAYYLCLAVSNTDDLSSPSLGWYAYQYQLTSIVLGQTSGVLNFPDWAKLGTWTDGYYVTMDLQDASPNGNHAEIGVAVCVFDRNDILAQNTASPPAVLGPVCTTPSVTLDSSSGTYLGHSIIPADIDGTTAPPAGRPEYMVSIENPSITSNQTTSSAINLWETQVNWAANPPTLTVTSTQPAVQPYTPGCYLYAPSAPAITNCVLEPQNNGQQIVDSVGDRLMPRFPYRNFGSYESYLVSHAVQTGPGSSGTNPDAYQTGIRWYEIRVDGSGTPYIYQQNTVNPDSLLFRFLPSIAQDKNGNAAVGYSVSSLLTNPGINFSFWNLGSNAGPTEVPILAGPGEQVTTINNGVGLWGTYSSMTVDPFSPSNDCTFWYVNEYYPADSDVAWSTRITNFAIPGCQ